MATIKDIAREAGVAISTVSYVLNGHYSKVSDETRKRVLDIAEKLNYQPNGAARDLKRQKNNTIGLFLQNLGGPYYSNLIRGVNDVTYANDYDLIACDASRGENSSAYTYLREKRVDGAIVSAPALTDELILSISRKGFPIILLDREVLDSEYIFSVLLDNFNGAMKAVNHLIDLGFKEIYFLSGPEDAYDNQKRFEGYQKALSNNGLDFSDELIINGDFTEESGYQAIKNILKSSICPEAIFSANDEMAIGAIKAFKEAGIKVPEEVSIVGFDDIELSSYIQPPLTTINHPKRKMGAIAAELIFKTLNGDVADKTTILPHELIIRNSTRRKKEEA